jgi:lipoate-protein ligase A
MPEIAILDYCLGNVYRNLALEELLLGEVVKESLPPLVRIWHNPKSVIMGISRSIEKDVLNNNLVEDNIPLARRISGGGTVYHDEGTISFSFIFPWSLLGFDDDPRKVDDRSIDPFLDIIIDSLASFGLKAYRKGISDIFIEGKKISGNAQKRVRKAILHHGTVLFRVDIGRMNRYLKIPPERVGIPHDDFVTSLENLNKDIKEDDFINAFRESLERKGMVISEYIPDRGLIEKAYELADSVYRKDEWIFRRP